MNKYSLKVDAWRDAVRFTTNFGLWFNLPNYSLTYASQGHYERVKLALILPPEKYWTELSEAGVLDITAPKTRGPITSHGRARWAKSVEAKVETLDLQAGLDRWACLFLNPLESELVAERLTVKVRDALDRLVSLPFVYSESLAGDKLPYFAAPEAKANFQEELVFLCGPLA